MTSSNPSAKCIIGNSNDSFINIAFHPAASGDVVRSTRRTVCRMVPKDLREGLAKVKVEDISTHSSGEVELRPEHIIVQDFKVNW